MMGGMGGVSVNDSACQQLGVAAQTIGPPTNTSAQPQWLAMLRELRVECRASLGLNGSLFDEPALEWTQSAYVQTQSHPFDPTFFNGTHYTVDDWANGLVAAYGGVDGVLLWPTYPLLGYDDRNQFDIIRSLPGGVPAIKRVVSELHVRGIHVLWPYNPWDRETRPPSQPDPQAMAQLLATTGADGFNGDTMSLIPEAFYRASVAAGRPAAMQAEDGAKLQSLKWTTLGWGEAGGWGSLPARGPPMVPAYRWLQPRRMTNICRRNDVDRNTALQHALFNGMGIESWENVCLRPSHGR
jgi:iron(II)-dependent oxidoreductase